MTENAALKHPEIYGEILDRLRGASLPIQLGIDFVWRSLTEAGRRDLMVIMFAAESSFKGLLEEVERGEREGLDMILKLRTLGVEPDRLIEKCGIILDYMEKSTGEDETESEADHE